MRVLFLLEKSPARIAPFCGKIKNMQFSQLSRTLLEIEAIDARLQITQVLSTLWLQLDAQEAWQTANLIQGQLQPPYEQLVFNLSSKMIARSLAILALANGGLAGGVSVDLFGQADEESLLEQIKKIHQRFGDWGETAAEVHRQLFGTRPSSLSIDDVYAQLVAIAKLSGNGSQQAKIDALADLITKVDDVSTKFIVRMVIGKLRLGFATMTILDSLSWAVCGDKSESKMLESVWQKKADVGILAGSYLALKQLPPAQRQQRLAQEYQATVGIPLVPALCQRLNSTTDIIEKVGPVIAEPKYDGMRIQIHFRRHPQPQVFAFTRSLENVSSMFPELMTFVASLDVDEAIFDSEAVGFNVETGAMLPFQETISRRRIHDVAIKAEAIKMKFFIFDLMLLDGQELITHPLAQRKQLLRQTVSDSDVAQVTHYLTTQDAQELRQFHQTQLQAGLEGMVAKGEQSTYQSGRKGWHWVKIKEVEGTRGKLNDTLDLVIMGYYFGQGRRHDMGVGALLAGVRTADGSYQTITKIGTGFTDENLITFRQMSESIRADKPPSTYQVERTLIPDVWLQPRLVAEIAADELTRSSMHTSHYGLRFPRIIRWREDKTAAEATSVAELANIAIDKGE